LQESSAIDGRTTSVFNHNFDDSLGGAMLTRRKRRVNLFWRKPAGCACVEIRFGRAHAGEIMQTRRLYVQLAFILTASVASAQAPIPTADANKRGLTDKDFPKVVKLADNAYAIEILPAQGPNAQPNATRVTTNSMAVVTTDGVLVADTQGSIV